MGDDTVIVVPEVQEPEPVQTDTTRDEILMRYGELLARVEHLEALNARCDGFELSLRTCEERITGQELALAGYAPIEHTHEQYVTREEVNPEPAITTEPAKEPEREPEPQNLWFKRIGR